MKGQDASDALARTVAVNAITIGQCFYLLHSRCLVDSPVSIRATSKQGPAYGHRRGGGAATDVHLPAAAATHLRHRAGAVACVALAAGRRAAVLLRRRGREDRHQAEAPLGGTSISSGPQRRLPRPIR